MHVLNYNVVIHLHFYDYQWVNTATCGLHVHVLVLENIISPVSRIAVQSVPIATKVVNLSVLQQHYVIKFVSD
jgi:hypothetical protein